MVKEIMSEAMNLEQTWREFMTQFVQLCEQQGAPIIESDESWASPCEYQVEGGTSWRPLEQTEVGENNNFTNIKDALGVDVHKDYAEFFTLYFANNIDAQHQDGVLQFLQAWSQDDFERLQQNLIGHLMMKTKLKQEPTLFFALTEQDDLNLVMKNDSGEVWLEYVGQEPHEKVSDSLAEFISQTKPVLV